MSTNSLVISFAQRAVHVNNGFIIYPGDIALKGCDFHKLIESFPLVLFRIEIIKPKFSPLGAAQPIYPTGFNMLFLNEVGEGRNKLLATLKTNSIVVSIV